MMSPANRQRIETAGLLLAVFVAGGLGGAALERRSQERGPREPGGRELMAPPGEIPRFYEALDLSETQRAEIQAILDAARPESDSILREAMPRLREITRQTREDIARVLTDEQRARLEESFRRRRPGPPTDRSPDRSPGRRRGPTGPGGGNP